jgi:hypothetical protein
MRRFFSGSDFSIAVIFSCDLSIGVFLLSRFLGRGERVAARGCNTAGLFSYQARTSRGKSRQSSARPHFLLSSTSPLPNTFLISEKIRTYRRKLHTNVTRKGIIFSI